MSVFSIPGFKPYLLVVFLNAFVDLGHKILIQNTVFKIYQGEFQIILTAILNALILLPFIFSFTPAGFCSDRYPKNLIMRFSAWVAVALTLFITLFYYLGWFWPAFAMTFMLALQSAFYSPAKYGYIKELVGKERLSIANGAVQATTITAILFGLLAFSILFELLLKGKSYTDTASLLMHIASIGWVLVALSLAEAGLCYSIPKTPRPEPNKPFDWKKYIYGIYLRENLRRVKNHEIILLSIIGLSIFWAISQVVVATFPAHAKQVLNIYNTVVIQGMMACSGIGIVIGAMLAGHLSSKHIETGLIPIGCLGITLTLIVLSLSNSLLLQAANFFAWGIFGGFVIVPLNSLIQFHAGPDNLGRVLATNNLFQNVCMVSFLALTIILARSGASSHFLLTLLWLIAMLSTIYSVRKLPQSMLRFVFTWIIGRHYRLEVQGLGNMPERGGVLLLSNHISWLDWAMLQIASPRMIRFVMIRDIYEKPYLKWFLDMFRCIPISQTRFGKTITEIRESLNAGELVCLFPEGAISRTGQLGKFHRGFEKAAEGANAIILPCYIRGMWASVFSRSGSRLRQLHGHTIKRDIIVAFGTPMTIAAKAEEVKLKIFELSIQTWDNYSRSLPDIGRAFIDSAKNNGWNAMASDSSGKTLHGHQLLCAAICLSRHLRHDSNGPHIGLLLPSSSAGVIINMASFLLGKSVINLNFTSAPTALRHAVEKTGIHTIYTSKRFLDRLEKRGISATRIFHDYRLIALEDLAQEISPAEKLCTLLTVTLLPAVLLKRLYCKPTDPNALATILFTSGSEGQPKGVMLSHRNIMTNIKQVIDILNFDEEETVLGSLPLFHAFGMTVTTFMPIVTGLHVIFHPDPTDVVNIAKAVSRYRITMLCATPSFLRLYIQNRKVHPLMLESLRIVVAGGERLPPDIRADFKKKFNREVYEGYGVTETSPVASVNIPDALDINCWQIQEGSRHGTVGLPLPGTSYRIVDPDSMQPLPVGEAGLVLIGGMQIMLGYFMDEAKTADSITLIDGKRWYKTGDKGYLDEDGFLTIVDRYSRFAKLGGEMISLSAVEQSIRDALDDPELDLVALNIPDARKGEKIALLITGDHTLEHIRKALLERDTPGLMIPTTAVNVETIPKLGSGKTDFAAAKIHLIKALEQ